MLRRGPSDPNGDAMRASLSPLVLIMLLAARLRRAHLSREMLAGSSDDGYLIRARLDV